MARLDRLIESLPPGLGGRLNVKIEEQARCVLHLVAECKAVCGAAIPPDPATCPNCGNLCASERSPYCSFLCREEAGFVRQFRTGLAEGSILDEARQIAFGQNLWHLLGAGYPLRHSLVPEKTVQKVIVREGGGCYYCASPATSVDHIGSGCGRPINLRPVCDACSRTKPFCDATLLARAEVQEQLERLAVRIQSASPLRCCDDGGAWDWRDYLRRRGRDAIVER